MKSGTQRIFRGVKLFCILQCSIYVIIHLSKLTECTKSRVNHYVNCGLGAITMCQGRFIDEYNGTALVQDTDGRR